MNKKDNINKLIENAHSFANWLQFPHDCPTGERVKVLKLKETVALIWPSSISKIE